MSKRRLILMRHAKSAWPDDVDDRERPLATRGRKAAPAMGQYLTRENLVPDLAIVSTAKRSMQTWAFVAPKLGRDVPVQYCEDLYEATAEDILRRIRGAAGTVQTLMVIGHNPGLGELAVALSDGSAPGTEADMQEKFPTAAVAVIDFDVANWSEIDRWSGQLQRFVVPRMLA